MSVFDQHKDGAPSALEADLQTVAVLEEILRALARDDAAYAFSLYRQAENVLQIEDLPPESIRPLAEAAAEARAGEEALRLLHGFSGRFPDHADVVKNYLLAAQIMRRDFSREDDAISLLDGVAHRYAQHPDFALIAALRAEIKGDFNEK